MSQRAKPERKRKQKYRLYQESQLCALCGGWITILELYTPEITLDHKVRKRDGGRNGLYNVQLAHKTCNQERD